MGVIYKVTNLINNKIYIGQTVKTEPQRWQAHVWSAYNNPENDCIALCAAIRKYGKENFKREILEEIENTDELNNREIYYIQLYNSYNPTYGYNICLGGDGHTKYDSKIILELYNKYRSIAKVAQILQAHKSTISVRLQGMGINTYNTTVLQYNIEGELINTFSSFSEARNLFPNLNLPRIIPYHHFYGGYFWIYEKDNLEISDIIQNYKTSPLLIKHIEQYDLYGKLLNTFDSAAEASRVLHINVSSIKAALNGIQNTAGGYIWHRINGQFSFEEQYIQYLKSASCCEIEEIDEQGNVLGRYQSAVYFEKLMNWSYQSVKLVCDGKKTHTHGRLFQYAHPDKRKLIQEKIL